MNRELLDEKSTEEFRKLMQNSENMEKELNCYLVLMKEMIIRSYCPN